MDGLDLDFISDKEAKEEDFETSDEEAQKITVKEQKTAF